MLHSPRRALVAAVTLLAFGHVWLANTETPEVPLADAARFEGRDVVVQGLVREVARYDDETRLVLAMDGHGLEVRTQNLDVQRGAVLRAEGRLTRMGTGLVLLANHVEPGEPPDATPAALNDLFGRPPDRLVRVTGTIKDGQITASGTRVWLGDGPWPEAGRVSASVLAVPDASCACIRLHAQSVRPWMD